jgi:aspartate aminotransferase-like enzyme
LNFEAVEFPWGTAMDWNLVRRKFEQTPAPAWLWCTHCETSTGVLNDLERLKALCAEFQTKLCLDCISSIGTVPVDLTGVYLASCASGKGLRSYPGVSMVFYHHDLGASPARLPRYLDLSYYAAQQGTPFTFSSNLLHALHAAVNRVHWDKRFAELEGLSAGLRSRLAELGIELIGNGAKTSPAVITFTLPASLNSAEVGDRLRESGYLLSYNSEYLRRRNWLQICFMSDCPKEKLVSLLNALSRACFRKRGAPALSDESSEQAPAAKSDRHE